MKHKDHFSAIAGDYQLYRPDYPPELFAALAALAPAQQHAWDCGTGNGQAAFHLANYFEKVSATDISQAQLNEAVQKENISYTVSSAEKTFFPDNSFDLICAAQAAHWFQHDLFYAEVNRVIRKNGILCLIAYGLIEGEYSLNPAIQYLYKDILGTYWDPERKHIDARYQTVPFPFPELELPVFSIRKEMNLDQLMGYFNTWSALRHYLRHNMNPLPEIRGLLQKAWSGDPASPKAFHFPVYTRTARLKTG